MMVQWIKEHSTELFWTTWLVILAGTLIQLLVTQNTLKRKVIENKHRMERVEQLISEDLAYAEKSFQTHHINKATLEQFYEEYKKKECKDVKANKGP